MQASSLLPKRVSGHRPRNLARCKHLFLIKRDARYQLTQLGCGITYRYTLHTRESFRLSCIERERERARGSRAIAQNPNKLLSYPICVLRGKLVKQSLLSRRYNRIRQNDVNLFCVVLMSRRNSEFFCREKISFSKDEETVLSPGRPSFTNFPSLSQHNVTIVNQMRAWCLCWKIMSTSGTRMYTTDTSGSHIRPIHFHRETTPAV